MKTLFLVLDGAGDEKIPALKGKTPLETASIPNLDLIAWKGKAGLLHTVREGIAPESDQAVFSLLGFDPFTQYTGRGQVEALGAGLELDGKGLAFRGNFAIVEGGKVLETSAKISTRENEKLCKALNARLAAFNARLFPGKGYRFFLLLEGKWSENVGNTHPGYEFAEGRVTSATRKRFGTAVKKCRPLSRDALARETAKRINSVIEAIAVALKENRGANFALLRGASLNVPRVRGLKGKWALFSASSAVKGVGKVAGMQVMEMPPEYEKLAVAVSRALRGFDGVYVHLKAPDKHAHGRDFEGKVKALEEIDQEFVGKLKVLPGTRIVLTADHCTSSLTGTHTSRAVPFAISSEKPDGLEFNEAACGKGSLGVFGAKKLKGLLRI